MILAVYLTVTVLLLFAIGITHAMRTDVVETMEELAIYASAFLWFVMFPMLVVVFAVSAIIASGEWVGEMIMARKDTDK